MRIVALVCRILFGIMFVVFGLNGFLHFIPMGEVPPPDSLPGKFLGSLMASGFMHLVSALQVVGGVLVLLGITAPLGLVLLGPIVVVALLFHLLMAGGHGIAPAAMATVLEGILIFAYRGHFAGIFDFHSQPTV